MAACRWFKWIAAVMTIMLLVGIGLCPCPALVISKQRGPAVLWIPLNNGDCFTYEYIHSVQKTPVQEHFVSAPGFKMLLTSTTYQSYGVGLPFLPEEGQLEMKNGKFELKGLNRYYEVIHIGYIPLACQGLTYGGKKYDFNNYFNSGEMIDIEIKEYSLVTILVHESREFWGGHFAQRYQETG